MHLKWNKTLGPDSCPYIRLWMFSCFFFSVRLHHWLHSDDTRHFHDHGWNFISWVISGELIDRTEEGDEIRPQWSLKTFKAEHRHAVVVEQPAWTILLCGREQRQWGFWVNGKFRKRNKYFFEHEHHDPCDALDTKSVDIKPFL